MSLEAIIMMALGITVIWGGLLLSVGYAFYATSKRKK